MGYGRNRKVGKTMKVILAVDMPSYIDYEDLERYQAEIKICDKYEDLYVFAKYDLPLKPLPQKLEYKYIEDDNIEISKVIEKSNWYRFAKPNEVIEFRSFAEGYNACINEILGESEK